MQQNIILSLSLDIFVYLLDSSFLPKISVYIISFPIDSEQLDPRFNENQGVTLSTHRRPSHWVQFTQTVSTYRESHELPILENKRRKSLGDGNRAFYSQIIRSLWVHLRDIIRPKGGTNDSIRAIKAWASPNCPRCGVRESILR